jgi:hypothetical protein
VRPSLCGTVNRLWCSPPDDDETQTKNGPHLLLDLTLLDWKTCRRMVSTNAHGRELQPDERIIQVYMEINPCQERIRHTAVAFPTSTKHNAIVAAITRVGVDIYGDSLRPDNMVLVMPTTRFW